MAVARIKGVESNAFDLSFINSDKAKSRSSCSAVLRERRARNWPPRLSTIQTSEVCGQFCLREEDEKEKKKKRERERLVVEKQISVR